MRAFVAVEVGEGVRAEIAKLQSELPAEVKLVEAQNIHMTLAFLGDVKEAKLAEVKAALEGVNAAPFEVLCRGVGVFPSENFVRVVWAGADSRELEALHSQVSNALEPLGFKPDKFSPHITIGRPKTKVAIDAFLKSHSGRIMGSFEVTELKIKKSTLTPKGPVYEDIFVKQLG